MRKRTGRKWCERFKIHAGHDIRDMDGWNNKTKKCWPYCFCKEKIDLEEFMKRVAQCTTRQGAGGFKRMDEEYKRVLK